MTHRHPRGTRRVHGPQRLGLRHNRGTRSRSQRSQPLVRFARLVPRQRVPHQRIHRRKYQNAHAEDTPHRPPASATLPKQWKRRPVQCAVLGRVRRRPHSWQGPCALVRKLPMQNAARGGVCGAK
eukprot:4524270-Prymnesium_polylepis.1